MTLNRQGQVTSWSMRRAAAGAIAACKASAPDLCILDINLPDQNGIAIVPAIKSASRIPTCLSAPPTRRQSAGRGLARGGQRFRREDKHLGRFPRRRRSGGSRRAIFSSKSSGVAPLSRAALAQRQKPSRRASSSAEGRRVIRWIAQGCTSKEIAKKLFISVATVETHRTNVMSKVVSGMSPAWSSTRFSMVWWRRPTLSLPDRAWPTRAGGLGLGDDRKRRPRAG